MSRVQKDPLRRLGESERAELERISSFEPVAAAQVRARPSLAGETASLRLAVPSNHLCMH